MALYRKKPVVIEAFQIDLYDSDPDFPDFILDAFARNIIVIDENKAEITIRTLEGTLYAKHLDWIIKGVKGEIYPCKPDIFEKTYEKVEGGENG